MENNEKEYICLVNDEEQYSLWFSWKEIPRGWKQVGNVGTKEEILSFIQKIWVDMRPKSLREKMKN
jgi:MbtH protein